MLTIQIDDDAIESRLRERAAANGRSPEDEAREILATALLTPPAVEASGKAETEHTLLDADRDVISRKRVSLAQSIHEEFAKLGGVELDLGWIRKLSNRKPPTFD